MCLEFCGNSIGIKKTYTNPDIKQYTVLGGILVTVEVETFIYELRVVDPQHLTEFAPCEFHLSLALADTKYLPKDKHTRRIFQKERSVCPT